MERRVKLREDRLREQEERHLKETYSSGEGGTRDVASGSGTIHGEQVISYKSIPNKVFGGPIAGLTSTDRGQTGRSGSPTERKVIGQEIKIQTTTRQYKIKPPPVR